MVPSFWSFGAAQALSGAPCTLRKGMAGASCGMPPPGDVDILVGCTPCQPFSLFRDTEGIPPAKHPLYGATFWEKGSIIELASELKPQVLVIEQVKGFLKSPPQKNSKTYKQQLVDHILAITGDDEGTTRFSAGITLEVNSATFSDTSRPRFHS